MRRDGTALVVEPTVWMSSSSTGDRRFHALYRDVGTPAASRTALSEAEHELTLSRAHVRAAFESSPTAGAIVESDDTMVEVNPALCRLLGSSPPTLVGRSFASLLDPGDRSASLPGLAEVRATGISLTRVEVRCVTATGLTVWRLLSLIAVGHDTDTGFVMVRMENIQDLKNLQAALAHQASHDPSPGCRTGPCSPTTSVVCSPGHGPAPKQTPTRR